MKYPIFNLQSSILNSLALALMLAGAAPARAIVLTNAPVVFDLGNIIGGPATNRVMQIRPANGPFTWRGRLIAQDVIKSVTTTDGTVTNNLLPALYTIDVQAPPAASRFYITVPDTNATLYASDLVETNLTTGTAAGAYSRAQVDALLAAIPATTNSTSSVFELDNDGNLTPSTTTTSDNYWQTINGDLTPK